MEGTFRHIDKDKYWYGDGNIKQKIKNLLQLSKKNLHKNLNIHKSNVILVPHAGFDASGYCSASAFQQFLNNDLTPKHTNFNQIIILSTSHKLHNLIFPDNSIHKGIFRNIHTPINKIKNFVNNNKHCKIDNDELIKEHSHKNVIPFVEYCFPNISILPILIGNINDYNTIGKNLYNSFNKNTLWILNTDLLHVNGHFKYKLPKKNINRTINNIESNIMKYVLERDINKFNKIIEKENPSICGISVLKLFLSIPFNNIIGKVCCYYQNNQIDNIKNNILNYNNLNTNYSIVSYCSSIFFPKNENELDNLLTKYEELELLEYSKSILQNRFHNNIIYRPFYSPSFYYNKGVFVTLKINNKLRGCIGTYDLNNNLIDNVHTYTISSAFNDSRFDKVSINELDKLTYSITLLNNKQIIDKKDLDKKYRLGKDGIILDCNNNSAIYLPQVPIEQKWNRIQTLESLSNKAGFYKSHWKHSECNILVIPGYEF